MVYRLCGISGVGGFGGMLMTVLRERGGVGWEHLDVVYDIANFVLTFLSTKTNLNLAHI